MTNREQGRQDAAQRLADLEAALDAYGADRTRWPAPVRHGLSGFIAGNADAQRMVREAEAFDRLLDQAPTLSAERLEALAARIDASTEHQPRMIHRSGGGRTSAPSIAGFARREHAWAAAALAASLVLGIFAGQAPSIDPAASLLIQSAANDDGGGQQLALTDDAESLLDEDLL